ncbi:MAG: oligosaccharide flippase family protein [Firmicutes bacterium]|nr:oligosaccharide flippase family protein [Bacillota bacterium]
MKRSIFQAVVLITIITVLSRALGFVFRVYISRVIGPEGVGIYQIAMSVFWVLATIIASGIPLTVCKQTANHKIINNQLAINKTTTAALVVCLVVSGILIGISLVFQNFIKGFFADERVFPIFLILLPSLVGTSLLSAFRGALWGEKRYFAFSITEFIEDVLRVALGFLMVVGVTSALDGALKAGLSFTIATTIAAFISGGFFFYYRGRLSNPKGYITPIIQNSWAITGIRVSSNLINAGIALIIPLRLMHGGLTASEAISQFGILMGMAIPLMYLPLTLIGSLATVIIPEMGKKDAEPEELKKSANDAIAFSVLVSLPFMFSFLALGTQIGTLLFNSPQAGDMMRAAAWIVLPVSLSQISNSMLNSQNLEERSFANFIAGSVFLFLCVWFLPPLLGVHSLILGLGGGAAITAALNFVMLKTRIDFSLGFIKQIVVVTLLGIPPLLVSVFSYNIMSYKFHTIIAIGLSGSVLMSTYALLLICFGIVQIPDKVLEKLKLKKVEAIDENNLAERQKTNTRNTIKNQVYLTRMLI